MSGLHRGDGDGDGECDDGAGDGCVDTGGDPHAAGAVTCAWASELNHEPTGAESPAARSASPPAPSASTAPSCAAGSPTSRSTPPTPPEPAPLAGCLSQRTARSGPDEPADPVLHGPLPRALVRAEERRAGDPLSRGRQARRCVGGTEGVTADTGRARRRRSTADDLPPDPDVGRRRSRAGAEDRGNSGPVSPPGRWQRMLWLNLFIDRAGDRHPKWRSEYVSVRGGGSQYFSLLVDVDAQRCSDLRINSAR